MFGKRDRHGNAVAPVVISGPELDIGALRLSVVLRPNQSKVRESFPKQKLPRRVQSPRRFYLLGKTAG